MVSHFLVYNEPHEDEVNAINVLKQKSYFKLHVLLGRLSIFGITYFIDWLKPSFSTQIIFLYFQNDRRSLRSPRRVSCGNLSSISEENAHSFQTSSDSNLRSSQGRIRHPLSVSDTNYIQEEFDETGNLLENRNGSCSSDRSSTSAEFSLSSCASEDGDIIDKENKVFDNSFGTKTPKVIHRSASDSWNSNTHNFTDTFLNRTNGIPIGRRASVQVDSDFYRQRFVENSASNEDIRPKLRRASMQCESVITKADTTQDMAKIISDFKLNYDFPCPLHAVMRQYGSSSNLRTNIKSKVDVAEREKPKETKNAKELVEEWQAVSRGSSQKLKLDTSNQKMDRHIQTQNPGAFMTLDENKDSSVDFRNVREQSFTSDYFGSVETVNSVMSLPTNVVHRRLLSVPNCHTDHATEIQNRRHSLPVSKNIASPRKRSGEYPSRNKCASTNSAFKTDRKHNLENVQNDEKLENDVFRNMDDLNYPTDENANLSPSKSESKMSVTSDEGYAPSIPNSPIIIRHNIPTSECYHKTELSNDFNSPNIVPTYNKTEVSQQRKDKNGLLETAL